MKTTLRLLTFVALFAVQLFSIAQTSDVPFSFQGYAIDPDGKSLGSTGITVKFTITGPSVTFEEEHALTSDAFGVFHAVIGNSSGAKKLEFSKLNFTNIDPANPVYFSLKVEVKKTSGGSYTTISDAPMNAVPYARYAANGVPVGTIVAFAGPKANIPAGWFYCNGGTISRTTYSQLYNAIGTSWGTGDGSTTFHLPYLLGHTLRGVDDGRGLDENKGSRSASGAGGNTGDNVGSVEWDQIASHTHSAWSDPAGNHAHNYNQPNIGSFSLQSNTSDFAGRTKEYVSDNGGTTTYNGNHSHAIGINYTGGAENQVDNAYVYWIIKY